MFLSITELISLIFFTNIVIILIAILLRKQLIFDKKIICCLTLCIGVTLSRLLIPVRLSFSRQIGVEKIYPNFYRILRKPIFNETSISILLLAYSIWGIGVAIQLIKLAVNYVKIHKYTKRFMEIEDINVVYLTEKIFREYNRKPRKIKILQSDMISSPYIAGVIKPYIVIPNVELSMKEWNFILHHELAHYYYGDLVYKLINEVLKVIYWWNPFIYFLSRSITEIIEIRADIRATEKFEDMQRVEYMECLLRIAKICIYKEEADKCMLLYQSDNSIIRKRINLLMRRSEGRQKGDIKDIISIVVVFLFTLLASYIVVEPYAEPSTEETFEINKDNSYFIDNGNGTYDLYYGDEFLGTMQSLFDLTIPVYEKGE